jgi:hypothetical protein
MAAFILSQTADPVAASRTALDELRFAEADTLAQTAIRGGNLSATHFAALLEVRAVANALLKKGATSKDIFTLLLSCVPNYRLPSQYGPRVRSSFLEARAKNTGRIEIIDRSVAGSGVCSLAVSDPLHFANQLRVTLVIDGKESTQTASLETSEQPLVFKGDGQAQGCSAEALDLYGNVLVKAPEGQDVFDQLKPAEPKPVAKVGIEESTNAPPDPASLAQLAPSAPVKSLTPLRLTSFILGGLAIASAGTGAWFGYASQDPVRVLANVQRDEQGRIVSLTQADSVLVTERSQNQAVLANVFFGVASALAVGTLVTFLISLMDG